MEQHVASHITNAISVTLPIPGLITPLHLYYTAHKNSVSNETINNNIQSYQEEHKSHVLAAEKCEIQSSTFKAEHRHLTDI